MPCNGSRNEGMKLFILTTFATLFGICRKPGLPAANRRRGC